MVTFFLSRLENRLESFGIPSRTKSLVKDLFQAAQKGMSDEECALAYSRCPVNIAVEPLSNSILGKIFYRSKQEQPSKRPVNSGINHGLDGKGNLMITGNTIYRPGLPRDPIKSNIVRRLSQYWTRWPLVTTTKTKRYLLNLIATVRKREQLKATIIATQQDWRGVDLIHRCLKTCLCSPIDDVLPPM